MHIKIKELVGKNPVSYKQATILLNEMSKHINKEKIVLDFAGTSVISSPFFNGSIGILLGQFTITDLQEKIEFKEISDNGRHILNQVIKNAIDFHKNPQ
jgi:hypothetical protein